MGMPRSPPLGGPLDAGVDEGGTIFRPHGGIAGTADISSGSDWTGGDVARIAIVPEPAVMSLLIVDVPLLLHRRK